VPVNLPLFPCAYLVDADNDGFQDLFISPFASNASQEGQSQDVNVVQYYHNIGIDTISQFHYMGDTMMINGIIDVGTESHPVFFDYNNDGLMDVVVGNYGRFEPNGFPKSDLALYTNTGTATAPQYEETSLDWNSLSTYQLQGIYPAFGDLDGDGKADMVVGDVTGNISFFKNSGSTTTPFPSMTSHNWFGINLVANAAPFIYDVNGDSLNDLVIGTKNNNISYYWNFGTKTNPMFSPDSVITNFGGIRVYDYRVAGTPPGYATPYITKENGIAVLYSGSQRGITFKYAIDANLHSNSFMLLDSNVISDLPGQRSTVSIADINHDGINDYLTGSIRGGVNLYSDVNWGNVPQISGIIENSPAKYQLRVYPNPAKDKVFCTISGSTVRLVSAVLYDLVGNKLVVPVANQDENTLVLSTGALSEGIYVVQVGDSNGQTYQKKLTIFNK
jgi:hypothetical protein